jgi:PAS domain S-box-containing protein
MPKVELEAQGPQNEIRELRRLLRDLTALSTMPALWVGRDIGHIAEGVADLLLHTLNADAVYVAAHSGMPVEVVGAARYPDFKAEVERLRIEAGERGLYVERVALSSWSSHLTVALYPIGLSKDDGLIAVGSSNRGFPSESEGLLLSVAANHVAVAFQTANLRAKAERERQRFSDLTALAPAAIGVLEGPEHRWVYVNENYVRVTGRLSASEFLGKTVRETLPELVGQPFFGILDEVYRSSQPFVGSEMKVALDRTESGLPEEAYFDFVYQPMFSAGGQVEGILIHAVEVTEKVLARRKLETALVASQRLAAIVESSDDAIVSKDLNSIVTSWNPAAERMFGYTAEEMIGRSIRTIIPSELETDEDRILATIARGDRIEHFETVRLKKDGQLIDVSLTVSPVKNEAGQIIGAAKIARDITERKKAESALRTTERLAAVGRLAATVAHEINNPLEAVINIVYLAKSRAVRDDIRDLLAQAEEEVGRISNLTKQTLGFYRDTNTVTAVRVSSLVNPLITAFAPRMRNKQVETRLEVRDDPEIGAIPGEMRQIFANLLSNSIDAVKDGGRIRIRISKSHGGNRHQTDGVRISIADSGSGIPSEVRKHVFEPFFTTKKAVGTGLGLWVCKNIVDKHCGSIRLKSSTAPGRSWTVISVFLPCSNQSLAEAVVKQEIEAAARQS